MNRTFAIIGCGRIAQRHAEHIAKHGRLVAVCDNVKERADSMALQHGAVAYYNIDDFARSEKVDIVAVCTPNGLHAAHSIKMLEAGMNVLCEKPMAINTDDCIKMREVAERFGRHLIVVKQNRFNPPVEAVKKLISEGRLGKIYCVQLNCFWNRDASYYFNSWKGTRELDGGTLFTQFSHFIDLLYWMIGEVKAVKSLTANYAHQGIIEFEDTGMAILEFEGGASGTLLYTVNSYKKNMEGSLTIFAEKGTVKIGGEYLNRVDYQNIQDYSIEESAGDKGANDYGAYQGSMSNHDKVYENVANFLDGKEGVYVNSFEAMKTVEIIERIYASAKG